MDGLPVIKRCPHDRTELVTFEHRGLNIDACHTCGGIWMELTEFSRIVNSAPSLTQIEKEVEPSSDYQPKAGFDICPSGHGPMERYDYAATRTIILDRCSTCGGIWLDDGECKQIAERLQNRKPVMTPEHQTVFAQLAAEHQATLDHIQTEKEVADFLGRRRWWLLGFQ